MIDIKFIRENPELIEKKAREKGFELNITHILEIDKRYRELLIAVQELQSQRNVFAKEKNIEEGKRIKVRLEKEQHALNAVKEELDNELLKIPNLSKDDVKVGKNESENDVVKRVGVVPQFAFTPKDHLELGIALDGIDVERAAKVSGTRFSYLKNDLVFLEFALVQFAFDILAKEGFTPIIPPVLIRRDVMAGLGYMERGGEEDMFELEKENMFLIGTAEHTLVSMHKDELFQKKDLPKRYIGFSSSFRREAGSYGKDTRGILRVHQFDKVEMVSFTTEEESDAEHEFLLSLEEKLFELLGIPYQVVKMCTGDLGFPIARKYDIEAWMPGQNTYREVTSASTATDFQSRRLNIKYQDGAEKKYVHILNGTAFAIGRTIIAILENFQKEDGSVEIPEVLRPFMQGKSIIASAE